MLEQLLPWLPWILAGVIVLLVLHALSLHIRVSRLTKRYGYFMNGESGQSIERRLAIEVKELRDMASTWETIIAEQKVIQSTQAQTFQYIGFVKYNAFENIGNELSFSLTLLDGNYNGIVISSVYGRNESRIFTKPIVNGKSLASLSQEELASLQSAMGQRSNGDVLASSSVSA